MRFQIRSPSRLHLSLIDLNGSLGRIDGGFGFALDNPNFVIEFNDSEDSIVIKGEKFIFIGPDEYLKYVQLIIIDSSI